MIAREGLRVLLPIFAMTLITGLLGYYYQNSWLLGFYTFFGFIFVFSLFFFRDPDRKIRKDSNVILSPADGKVVQIVELDDEEVGNDATQVSIFLSVFNVHVNRVPVEGKVRSKQYHQGRFRMAFNHKASEDNERAEVVMENSHGTVRIRQIAGAIARRIYCYAEPGLEMDQGGRLGYIMFGSRTDIIFPNHVQVHVSEGTSVKGGLSVIGTYS